MIQSYAIDPSATVAPTARIHPGARIGAQCVIGDFCVIEDRCRGGRVLPAGAVCFCEALDYARRAQRNLRRHRPGHRPTGQELHGARSYLKIGNRNIIREHYTISRGTQPESVTLIGDGNYIMTSGHIAHNCVIGNQTVIASCALVAGHVEVEDQAFLSGGVVVHQFSKIGRLAMVGGTLG